MLLCIQFPIIGMTQKIIVAVKEEKIDDTLMPEVHVSEAASTYTMHDVLFAASKMYFKYLIEIIPL